MTDVMTLQELFAQAQYYAQAVHEGHVPDGTSIARSDALERFMEFVFEIGLSLQAHPDEKESPESVEARQKIGAWIKPHSHWLKSYIEQTRSIFSTTSQEGAWAKMSRRRSALAFLTDLSAETPFEMGANTLDLSPIDDMIFDIGDTEGYLPADQVPANIPEEHWWWWYPDSPP